MNFSSKKGWKDAIPACYKNKRSIDITKNYKIKVYAKCAAKEYEWKLHALKLSRECTYQIRKYVPGPTCVVSFHVKNLKSTWLSRKYLCKSYQNQREM